MKNVPKFTQHSVCMNYKNNKEHGCFHLSEKNSVVFLFSGLTTQGKSEGDIWQNHWINTLPISLVCLLPLSLTPPIK